MQLIFANTVKTDTSIHTLKCGQVSWTLENLVQWNGHCKVIIWISDFRISQKPIFVEPLDGIFWQIGGSSQLEVATLEHKSETCFNRSYNGSFSDIMEGSCVEKSHRICKKELASDNCFLDGFTIDPIIWIIESVQTMDVFECKQLCQENDNCAVATFRKGNRLCQLHNHGP